MRTRTKTIRNMKTEQRRPYERPRMWVVPLQQRTQLLAGSPGGFGERPDYTPDDDNPFGG